MSFDGSNKEALQLQLVFLPNEFPFDFVDGLHSILWYNTPAQPQDNERMTEDISAKLRGCQDEDEKPYFVRYVTLPPTFDVLYA